MSALKDCLSTLSVIATGHRPAEAAREAAAAIDHFIDKTRRDAGDVLTALEELRKGLDAMRIETSAGAIVWAILNTRIETRTAELAQTRP